MTTIAYRNGIIAADTGLTRGSLRNSFVSKIAKNKDGALAGACGSAWWIAAFLKWFMDGGEMLHNPDEGCDTAIIIDRRRRMTLYESEKSKTWSYEVRGPYHALGSGCMVAFGALHSGAHPVDAVKAAIAHDESTYGRVESLKLGW